MTSEGEQALDLLAQGLGREAQHHRGNGVPKRAWWSSPVKMGSESFEKWWFIPVVLFFSITRHTRHMVLFVQYWGGNGGNLLISTFRKQ